MFQSAKTFLTGRHDGVLQGVIDGGAITLFIDAVRTGNISDVQMWSQEAYDELWRCLGLGCESNFVIASDFWRRDNCCGRPSQEYS